MVAYQKTLNYKNNAALVFLMLACLFSPFRLFRTPGPVSFAWSDLFMLLAGMMVVNEALLGRRQLRVPSSFLFSYFLLVMGVMITWISAPQIANVHFGAKFLTSVIFLPLVCAWVCQSNIRHVSHIFLALVAGNLLIAVIAIANSNNIYILEFLGDSAVRAGRHGGPSFHPVWLANTCLITLPLCIYFVFKANNLALRGLALIATGVLVNAVIISGSRSALLGILVVLIPFVFLFSGRIRSISGRLLVWATLVLLAGYLLLILFSFESMPADVDSAFNRLVYSSGTAEHSSTTRLRFMGYAWNEFIDKPFTGTGFENIWLAHSGILSIFHSSGIFTGLGYIFWLLTCLFVFLILWLNHARVNFNWNEKLMLTAIFSSFIAWQFNALVQSYIAERSGYFSVGLLFCFYLYPLSLKGESASVDKLVN